MVDGSCIYSGEQQYSESTWGNDYERRFPEIEGALEFPKFPCSPSARRCSSLQITHQVLNVCAKN